MHFHVPKPIHGWKQFFNEVAVIAVGIAIALTGEQLLERWNEHHQAERALAAIRDELSLNIGRMDSRVATERCLTQRLNQIAYFIDPPGGTMLPRPSWVGRPQTWNMQTSAFDTARAWGSLTVVSPDQQMAISLAYSSMAQFAEIEKEEQWAWAELRSITDDRDLSDNDKAELRRALQRARYAAWILHVSAVQASEEVAPLHVTPKPVRNGSKSVCIAMNTPFDRAVEMSGTKDIGEPR